MIPASHLLSGFLAGRAVRLTVDAPEPRSPWLDVVLLTAIGSSVFPDLDVVPGLLMHRGLSDLHRGLTHSPLGILLQTPLIAFGVRSVWKRVFHETPALRPLLWAALAGLTTHVFWDWLNTWGITPLWPWDKKSAANLMHEGDLWVVGALIVCSVLVGLRRYRWGFGLCLGFVVAYSLMQFQWKSTLQETAERELPAELIKTYPNGQLHCPWLVLARLTDTLQAFCASTPLSGARRVVTEVPILHDDRIDIANETIEVVEYKDRRDFPFAELRPHPDGSTTVLWRDLRESVFEIGTENPSGIYTRISPDGEVVGKDKKWFLKLWFW